MDLGQCWYEDCMGVTVNWAFSPFLSCSSFYGTIRCVYLRTEPYKKKKILRAIKLSRSNLCAPLCPSVYLRVLCG
jgi:hypothetical protein